MVAIFRLSKEHQHFRPDERSQQHPQTQVVNFFLRQAITLRELYRDQNRAQKCNREKQTVSVNWKTADVKEFRIHKPLSVVRGQLSVAGVISETPTDY